MTRDAGAEQVTRDERRRLIDFCCEDEFCKLGKWTDVRGHRVWARKEKDGRIRVAIHPALFGQIGKAADLRGLGPAELDRLCRLYGLGAGLVRNHAARMVELTPDCLAAHMNVSPFGKAGAAPGDTVTAGDNPPVTPQAPEGQGVESASDTVTGEASHAHA
jgi:hypothetical protein